MGDLWPYQHEAVQYALDKRRCFIALEMGGGKTVIALATLRQAGAYPAVVVCQAIMKPSWERHVREWLPGSTCQVVNAGDQIEMLALRPPNRTEIMWQAKRSVYIVNYDILHRYVASFQKIRPLFVLVDESTRVKNKKAQRTKAVNAISKYAYFKLALTGTPIDNGPADFVAQLKFLDRIKEFGGEWFFKKKFCVRTHHTGNIQTCDHDTCRRPLKWKHRSICPGCPGWEVCYCGQNVWGYWEFNGASNLVELNSRLRESCYFRKTKAEIQPYLPEFRREVVPIEISGKDREEYNTAQGDFIAWMQEKRGEEAAERAYRAEAIVKMEVLKQLVAKAKSNAIVEWIGQLVADEKVVVFVVHRAMIDEISDGSCLVIDGSTTSVGRESFVKKFQEDPDEMLLIVNIKTGGHGIELTAAAHCVFVELDWTSTAHEQAEARLHRHGQKRPVTAWYLLGERTIEETIFRMLERKRRVIAGAVDGKPESGVAFDLEMEVAHALKGVPEMQVAGSEEGQEGFGG